MRNFREIALNEAMVKILIWDKENTKKPEERIVPMKHARKLGKDGLSYKLQIIGDKDEIIDEYK